MKTTPKMNMASKMKTAPKMEKCSNVRCIIYYLKNLSMTLHLDRPNKTNPKPEMLSSVSGGNKIQRDERNVRGIEHAHTFRKDDF